MKYPTSLCEAMVVVSLYKETQKDKDDDDESTNERHNYVCFFEVG